MPAVGQGRTVRGGGAEPRPGRWSLGVMAPRSRVWPPGFSCHQRYSHAPSSFANGARPAAALTSWGRVPIKPANPDQPTGETPLSFKRTNEVWRPPGGVPSRQRGGTENRLLLLSQFAA